MAYRHSQIDKDNLKWFAHDNSRASLCSIELQKGTIRGLTPFLASLTYPITAFSGGNGSGKSTILALAACAFHNKKDGFYPPMRTKNYYTFHDFFVQSSAETPVEGVVIKYSIRHNNWRNSPPGIGSQARKKSKGGKWNDYDQRVSRNVIYFGVQRVVPHYERSTHKSYRAKFKPGNMAEVNRIRIASIAARVIGKSYTEYNSYEHTKYTLPVASANGISYSGFNMGAGEGSVFEVLTALFAAGEGALLIIDEIELGLHEQAQLRLMEEMKKLCREFKCQIICSTHSYAILRSIPPEARFHIENIGGNTFITPGASPEFACGKMGKPDAHELDIFVEDAVALEMVQLALPASVRKRVRIKSIGSHAAVIRQLSSRWLEKIDNCLCILDGDQKAASSGIVSIAYSACEASSSEQKNEISTWIKERVFYLPGSDWPEKWLFDEAKAIISNVNSSDSIDLSKSWGLSGVDELIACMDEAGSAEKHGEFRELAAALDLSETKVKSDIISFVINNNSEKFEALVENITKRLP